MLLKLQFLLHFSTRTPSYAFFLCSENTMSRNLLVICHVQTVNFECRLCDKTFRNSDELEIHLVKMHSNKPELNFKCDQCGYVTDDVLNFVKQILSHEAFKVCKYCNFVVKDKKDLKDHEIMVIT